MLFLTFLTLLHFRQPSPAGASQNICHQVFINFRAIYTYLPGGGGRSIWKVNHSVIGEGPPDIKYV